MPGGGGLCWCLGGRGPPEIKFGTDYDTPLKPVTVDIPMPTDEAELNAKFEELVVSKDFTFLFHLCVCLSRSHRVCKWPDCFYKHTYKQTQTKRSSVFLSVNPARKPFVCACFVQLFLYLFILSFVHWFVQSIIKSMYSFDTHSSMWWFFFHIYQVELDLDKPHRDALYSLPPEKKWQIYCSKKRVSHLYTCVLSLLFYSVLS